LLVLARNAGAFESRYGTALPVAGEYEGLLDSAGERIRLIDAVGEEILDFTYENRWHPATDGQGFSLVVVDELAEHTRWSSGDNWRASSRLGGAPGESDSLPGETDSDGDGLPDDWELAHGTDPHRPDADADPDGDGMPNREEYLAGTEPTDARSFLGLEVISGPGDTVKLRFQAQPRRRYSIEHTSRLRSEWSELAGFPDSAGSWIEIPIPTGADAQFYRVLCHPL
jgi:hypothetical protein